MKILKKAKENAFLLFVVCAYFALSAASPRMGWQAIKNSGYYIREMLMIMPVIFVLTALLDLWVPKEKILRYLGKNAGAKGVFLSFVVGSISAGPIYAAFPLCIMLHKKGASVRNLVIILSSWAVIKVPMLLNEAKFLGLKFMVIRWVLTVLAILVFSLLAAKLVPDESLPDELPGEAGPQIDRKACMGCMLCVKKCPELFEMRGKKAAVREAITTPEYMEALEDAVRSCPAHAIQSGAE